MKKREKFFIAPASITRRVIAFIIDMLIFDFIILFPFNKLFNKLIPGTTAMQQYSFVQQNPAVLKSLMPLLIITSIILVLYFSFFEYKLQQTPGKIILRIKIIPETKITFWNYLFSNLTFLPIFPFNLLWIIDPIYLIFSPKNQRFMEKINKIIVVQKYKY